MQGFLAFLYAQTVGYTVAVMVTDQSSEETYESPIYKYMSLGKTVKAMHTLFYPSICEHLQPATNAMRLRIYMTTPAVGSIEKHDHGPVGEEAVCGSASEMKENVE